MENFKRYGLFFLLTMALAGATLAQKSSYNARLTITGVGDENIPTDFSLPFICSPDRIDYGKTQGVDLFNIKVNNNCSVHGVNYIKELYAAYLQIPENCSAIDIITSLQHDGADYIFIESEKEMDFKVNRRAVTVPLFNVRKPNDRHFIEAVSITTKKLQESDAAKNLTNAETNQQSLYTTPLFRIFITFPHKITKDKYPKIEFFYGPANIRTFDFTSKLQSVYTTLKDYVKFEPYIYIYKLPFSTNSTRKPNPNCYLKTPYCAADPDGSGPYNGGDVVLESLREKCVSKQSKEGWFDYMSCFGSKCTNEYSEDCSNKCLSDAGLDKDKVKQCINENNVDEHENLILKTDYAKLKEFDDMIYPALYINGDKYRVIF